MRRRLRALFFSALLIAARRAGAQTPDELAQGRELFASALTDEEHQRYGEALEKYKRVLQIKDTPATHYRMGLTLEGLGKVTEAIDAHTAAVKLATGPKDAELARVAQARVDALEPRVGHLALKMPPTSKAPAEVRVDGVVVTAERLDDLRLDPGRHDVTVNAPESKPYEAQIKLGDGSHVELPVVLAPLDKPEPPPPPPPAPHASPLRTVGVVTGAAGAALLIAGGVVMAIRAGAISDLKTSCPEGACPSSRRTALEDLHARAETETVVGAVLLGVGAAALATGIVLFVIGRPAKNDDVALTWSPMVTF